MRAFPSPSSPQLLLLTVMINTEKQHIKLSGSLLFFSALFVLQVTIAMVEDWVYEATWAQFKVKVKMVQTEAMG